jgi:hypothetical protein
MKPMFTTAIIVGMAFLASGVIQLAMRQRFDVDLIVGAVFVVLGVIMRVARK